MCVYVCVLMCCCVVCCLVCAVCVLCHFCLFVFLGVYCGCRWLGGVAKRRWFSGKISRCHRDAPGSIPGRRISYAPPSSRCHPVNNILYNLSPTNTPTQRLTHGTRRPPHRYSTLPTTHAPCGTHTEDNELSLAVCHPHQFSRPDTRSDPSAHSI